MQQVTEEEDMMRERRLPPIKEFQRDYRAGKASTRIRYLHEFQFCLAKQQPRNSSISGLVLLTRSQMCSKNRDAAGNVAESEGRARRDNVNVVVVGVVVRPRCFEAIGDGAKDVGGPGGAEVEEGEGTGEGARESGKSAAEGGGEGGEDQAEGGEEAGEGREEASEEGSEGAAEGSRGGPPEG